ncbi:MAG: cytochrome c oxidase subunit II [Chloroflexi bacterium]|nr:cytochrome c oxidase subunit II [Chloroflexota bacterium]
MPSLRRLHLRRSAPLFFALWTILLSPALSGCSGSYYVLAPASPGASKIAAFFWLLVAIAGAVFLAVEALLIVAIVRFRHRPGAPEPDQIHGNLRLETLWTLVPVFILAAVFVAMASTMAAVTERPADALRVKVIGHQWWWEIQYPDLGFTTATDIHVPVGRPVEIEVLAVDVIHSFWSPDLAGKIDAVPGHTNLIQFTAGVLGVYRGWCAEFCGAQHANMGFLVVVQSEEDFEEWAKKVQEPARTPREGPAVRGAEAFFGRGCNGCHAIAGTAAQGKIGPNLTHFAGRRTIGAVALENNPGNLAAWLADPQAIKPGTQMPNLRLSPEVVQDLVSYLLAERENRD